MYYEQLLSGIPLFLTPLSILMVCLGVFLGLVIGVLPGLGPLMGIVLLIPMAGKLPPVSGLGLLLAVYIGGSCGGAVSAILLRIPGTPMAAATMIDGYPMAQKGKASEALGYSIAASTLGGLFGGVILILLAPYLANLALRFGPPEYFALAVTGLLSVAVVSIESTSKGIIVGILGLLTATVGVDSFSSVYRFTFGSTSLISGFNIVSIVVGLFALPEMFHQIANGNLSVKPRVESVRVSFRATLDTLKRWRTLVRSSLIGVFLGALPGTGGVVAAFAGYAAERSLSKTPERFGQGAEEGVIASQAADNSCVGGTLMPTLVLGIPGDPSSAVFMGALFLLGFFPGTALFEKHIDIVGGIFASYMAANIIMLFMGVLFTPIFVSLLKVKKQYLVPIIILLSVVGTYALQSSVYDLWVMLAFGVVGYFLRKFGYPLAPLIIGNVLGQIIEDNFRRSLVISGDSYQIFVDRPISAAILLVNFILILWLITPAGVRKRIWKRIVRVT